MIEEICLKLTNLVRKKRPNMTDERAEVINFAFLVLIGEGPKILLILFIAWWLKIFELTLITFVAMSVYRSQSGGFHLDGHMSCLFVSLLIFCGTGLLAKAMAGLAINLQYLLYALIFIFDLIIINKYAPADTQRIPVINEKVRKGKKIRSYIAVIAIYTFSITYLIITKNILIANICILTTFVQSLSMTQVAYELAKCEYGDVSKEKLGMV